MQVMRSNCWFVALFVLVAGFGWEAAAHRQSGFWSWTEFFGRRLQQYDGSRNCYEPLSGLEWTDNCFTQCRQAALFGFKENVYDFSWRNNNSALLDVLFLNPELAQSNDYFTNTSAVLPCYETALPPNALGGDVALGRQSDQSDTNTGGFAEFAVDNNPATCSLANATGDDFAWWRLNLTVVAEVAYVYLSVGVNMDEVVVWVTETEDIPNLDQASPCNEAVDMDKGVKWGIWCRGINNDFGRYGMYVWVSAKNAVGLCDANVYLRGSNAASFKQIVSANDATSITNLPAITDDDPLTSGWLQSRASNRIAFFTVDLGYSATVQAISFYHVSNTSLNVTVRVGDTQVTQGNENNLCSADLGYVVVPEDTAVIFACRNVKGRYVTLSIPGPGTMVVRDFGVYLYVKPEPIGSSSPAPTSSPLPSPPSPAAVAPALASDSSTTRMPATATAASQSQIFNYISLVMQLAGAGLATWNDSTRELQFEPALLDVWNHSSAPIEELTFLNENNSGNQLLMEYEVATAAAQIDAIRQDIGDSVNNGSVEASVKDRGLDITVKLYTLSSSYTVSKEGNSTSDANSTTAVVITPSSGSSFPLAVVIASTVTGVLLIALGLVLGVLIMRRRRRNRRDSFDMHKLPLSQANGHATPPSDTPSNGGQGGGNMWFDEHTAVAIVSKKGTSEDVSPADNSTLIAANSLMDTIYENKRSPRSSTPASHGNTPGSTHLGSPLSDHLSDASWRNAMTPASARVGQIERLWQVNYADVEIQKQIGEGSFGKVFLAKWRETIVAVKVLVSPDWGTWSAPATEEDVIMRQETADALLTSLEKEAAMMATLRHPNVVMYLGICLEPPCVVTEYCSRGSMNDVLKRARLSKNLALQLDWARRLNMALDAAKGMLYLHSHDPPIIHRDLKSPNLLVDKHWRVKVCDFNLSRFMEEQAVLSSVAATNPRWLAPEILSGQGYTCSSDVYSFGIILWELLSWQVPWYEYGPWQVVAMVTDGQQRPEIPPEDKQPSPSFSGQQEYLHLMNDCWAQTPEDRPSFASIIARLRQLLADEANLKQGSRLSMAMTEESRQASAQSDTVSSNMPPTPDLNNSRNDNTTEGQATVRSDCSAYNAQDSDKGVVAQGQDAAVRSDCTAYNERDSGKAVVVSDSAYTTSMPRSMAAASTSDSLQSEQRDDLMPERGEGSGEFLAQGSERGNMEDSAEEPQHPIMGPSAAEEGNAGVTRRFSDRARRFSWGDISKLSPIRHIRMGSLGSGRRKNGAGGEDGQGDSTLPGSDSAP